MPLVPLQQADPVLYKSWIENQAQPGASLGQTQASTQETKAQIPNTQAQLPGIQASSAKEQIQAQQAASLKNLSGDLHDKMTLPEAIDKYKTQGMSADDVFRQYLAQSPWGLPQENPTRLKQLGVTDAALGKVGNTGDFMDRYNTRNIVSGLRDLEGKFHQTNMLSGLENTLGIPFGSGNAAAAYNSGRAFLGEHLSTAVPGASNASSDVRTLMDALPKTGIPSDYDPGKATAKFQSIEDQLLQQKNYSPQDLGLSARSPDTTKPQSGKDVLSGLLGTILQPAKDLYNDNASAINNTVNDVQKAQKNNPNNPLNAAFESTGSLAKNLVGAMPADLQAALAIEGVRNLPSLASGGMGALKNILGGGSRAAATDATANLPGALKTFINPKGAISQAGNVRSAVVNAASKAGKTIDGDELASGIEKWASTGKMGNLGQGDAIDKAVEDAKGIFSGKSLDPKDIMKAYNEADSGYTKTGIAKSPIQANIDRGVRDVLGKALDNVAPGWEESTSAMSKGYQAQKSTLRGGVKTLAKFGIPLVVAGEGGNVLNHLLFGNHQ